MNYHKPIPALKSARDQDCTSQEARLAAGPDFSTNSKEGAFRPSTKSLAPESSFIALDASPMSQKEDEDASMALPDFFASMPYPSSARSQPHLRPRAKKSRSFDSVFRSIRPDYEETSMSTLSERHNVRAISFDESFEYVRTPAWPTRHHAHLSSPPPQIARQDNKEQETIETLMETAPTMPLD
jgi:hypothetical protein